MLANLTLLAISACFAAISLASLDGYVHDFACGFAGVFGGAIIQLLTLDKRNPTKKVILGEIFCSLVGGWATYVFAPEVVEIRQIVLSSIVAGAMGSAGFKLLIWKFAPAWLDVLEDSK